jgi:ketosteroid isomerase-like protein
LVSSANLELVRSIYAAWERGDWSSLDWADPEIEFVVADGPDPGSWTGIAAMAEAWRDHVSSVFEDARIEVNEYRELDDERILVLLIFHGRGRTSGLEVGGQMATKAANLLHVRNGKVTRIAIINDRERALADLGLASESGFSHS